MQQQSPSPNRSRVQQVEKKKRGQAKVQESEINRREKELIATVLKGAEIERPTHRNPAAAGEAAPNRLKLRLKRPPFVANVRPKPRIISKRGEAEARR